MRRVPFDVLSRRNVVWLLTLALAVIGSQLAHELAYRLVTPDGARRAHELAQTGHAYLVYAPAALAVCSVLVLIALAGELRHLLRRGTASSRPSALTFAVLAPAIFLLQEHFERLFHDGAFPWDACLQPTFVVGLLLQVPVAFGAYLLARLLLGAVRSLGRLLVGPVRRRSPVAGSFDPPPVCSFRGFPCSRSGTGRAAPRSPSADPGGGAVRVARRTRRRSA